MQVSSAWSNFKKNASDELMIKVGLWRKNIAAPCIKNPYSKEEVIKIKWIQQIKAFSSLVTVDAVVVWRNENQQRTKSELYPFF
jgi:hypothetical protein